MLDKNHAEKGASIVNDGPSDAVADVGCVGLTYVVHASCVKAVSNLHEGRVISTVVAKQSVEQGAKCGYVELQFKIIVRGLGGRRVTILGPLLGLKWPV